MKTVQYEVKSFSKTVTPANLPRGTALYFETHQYVVKNSLFFRYATDLCVGISVGGSICWRKLLNLDLALKIDLLDYFRVKVRSCRRFHSIRNSMLSACATP